MIEPLLLRVPPAFVNGQVTAAAWREGVSYVALSSRVTAGEHAVLAYRGELLLACVSLPAPALAIERFGAALAVLTASLELRTFAGVGDAASGDAASPRISAAPSPLRDANPDLVPAEAKTVFDLGVASCLGLHEGEPAAWVLVQGALWRATQSSWQEIARHDLHGRWSLVMGAAGLLAMGLAKQSARDRVVLLRWSGKTLTQHPLGGVYLHTKGAVSLGDYPARLLRDEHGDVYAVIDAFGRCLARHLDKGHFAMSPAEWRSGFDLGATLGNGICWSLESEPGGLVMRGQELPFDPASAASMATTRARPEKIAPWVTTDPTLLASQASHAQTGGFLPDGSVIVVSFSKTELVLHRWAKEASGWQETRYATPFSYTGYAPGWQWSAEPPACSSR